MALFMGFARAAEFVVSAPQRVIITVARAGKFTGNMKFRHSTISEADWPDF